MALSISKITPKGWLYIGIFLVVIILIILFIRNRNKTTTTTTTTTTIPSTTSSAITNITAPTKNDSFPLSYGSRGENVKKWQMYLNSKGSTLTVDGIWGPLTEAASIAKTGYNFITENYFKSVVS